MQLEQPQVFMLHITVAYLFMAEAKPSDFSVDNVASLTVGVLNHYLSSCVYFLHPTHQEDPQEDWHAADLMSSFSRESLMSAHLSAEKFVNLKQESCGRPLIVIRSTDHVTSCSLQEISAAGKFPKARWLLFVNESTSLEKLFANIYIPFDCEFLVAQWSVRTLELSLTELYRVFYNRPLQTFRVANWTSRGGFSWSSVPFFSRRNLQGITIKGAAIPYNPYLTLAKYSDKKATKYAGYLMELWNELESRMNFTTEYVAPNDAVFGSQLDDGSWSGVIGMVLREEADVGISFFAYLLDRMDAVDFLPPIWNVRLMVHIKQPEMETSSLNHILSPFVSALWSVMISAIVVLAVILSATWNLYKKFSINAGSACYSFYESLFCVYGSFCQQGHDTTPRTLASRLVFFVTYLVAVILFVAYSATFISFLAVRRYDLPFTDFKGLLEDGTYKLGVLSGSARVDFFKKSKTPTLNEVYRKLIRPGVDNLPRSDTEGLQRICDCDNVQEIKRTGILKRIEEKTWPPQYTEVLKDPPSGVTLATATIFFVVLLSGVMTSVLLLVIESGLRKLGQSCH